MCSLTEPMPSNTPKRVSQWAIVQFWFVELLKCDFKKLFLYSQFWILRRFVFSVQKLIFLVSYYQEVCQTCCNYKADVKYNWKNYVFDNLPANEDDNKSQSIFLHESFQLFDRKVAYLMGYSSFEPFDHKLCGGGARNRTAVRRIPLQVLISVETRTTPI